MHPSWTQKVWVFWMFHLRLILIFPRFAESKIGPPYTNIVNNNPAEHRLTNQLNTTAPLSLTFKYERKETANVIKTQYMGDPLGKHLAEKRGKCPPVAAPYIDLAEQ